MMNQTGIANIKGFNYKPGSSMPERVAELFRWLAQHQPNKSLPINRCVQAVQGSKRAPSQNSLDLEVFMRSWLPAARRPLREDRVFVLVSKTGLLRPTFSEDDIAENVTVKRLTSAGRAVSRAMHEVGETQVSKLSNPFHRQLIGEARRNLPRVGSVMNRLLDSIKGEKEKQKLLLAAAATPTPPKSEK